MAFLDRILYFLKNRNSFTFSGGEINCSIVQSRSGCSSFHAFRLYDEKGHREIETRHPETLRRLIKTKAALTFQIKQWAESRADGTLPLAIFSKRIAMELYPESKEYMPVDEDLETELSLPKWVVDAVETQKNKYYKKLISRSF